MKLTYGIIVFIFLMSFVVAEDVFIQQSAAHDLKRGCFNNGTFCSSAAVCNVTIFMPNGTLVVNNQVMTNMDSYHNITLSATDTAVKGTHQALMVCNDGAENGEDTFEILVNPTGIEPTDQRTNTMIFTVVFLMLLAGGLFIVSIRTQFIPLRITFFIVTAILVIISINVVFVNIQDEIVNPDIEDMFDTFTAASFYMYWGAGTMLFLIWTIAFFINLFDVRKANKKRKLLGDVDISGDLL